MTDAEQQENTSPQAVVAPPFDNGLASDATASTSSEQKLTVGGGDNNGIAPTPPVAGLIPIVNSLQEVLLASNSWRKKTATSSSSLQQSSSLATPPIGIALPHIAVVGAQSVGKSSVLESLVGRDFLPRGSGVVTRRPLLLELRRISEGNEEWAEFGHKRGKRYVDFNEVREEIVTETSRLVGAGSKVISAAPIALKIHSPRVVNLSLIDLPGVTKVPVGDQPQDIDSQTRNLVLDFISSPSCLILAVSAATTDLVNSDALSLARTVDPQGLRTLGVITKVDALEEGTDVTAILSGVTYPLRRGYVAVVCRSQRDVEAAKPISDGLAQEEDFFESRVEYEPFASRCGIKNLGNVMNQILLEEIRRALPTVRKDIFAAAKFWEEEASKYRDTSYGLDLKEPGSTILQIVSKFAQNFRDAIDGRLPPPSRRPSKSRDSQPPHAFREPQQQRGTSPSRCDDLWGGARINYLFKDSLGTRLSALSPLDDLSNDEIRIAIRNAAGLKASLFVPEAAFELLIRKQVERLRSPARECVSQVYEELLHIVQILSEMSHLAKFSNLKKQVLRVVNDVLSQCLQPSYAMIDNLINIELAFINTDHPDFLSAINYIDIHQDFEHSNGHFSATGGGNISSTATDAESASGQMFDAQWLQKRGFLFGRLRTPQPPHRPQRSSALERSSSSNNQHPDELATSANGDLPAGSRRTSHATIRGGGIGGQGLRGTREEGGREVVEVELIKGLIVSYFGIVKKNVGDAVPKALMYFMVNAAKDKLQRELVSRLHQKELFDELLKEDDSVGQKREEAEAALETIRRAVDILESVDRLSPESLK